MPDPTHTLLANDFDATNTDEYITASQTPLLNKLQVGLIYTHHQNNPSAPATVTLVGNGLTWVQIATEVMDVSGSGNGRLTLFRSMKATAPSAGVVTVTHSTSVHGCYWIFGEIDGLNTGGTNGSAAIVAANIKTNQGDDTSVNLTVTLDAFDHADNRSWGGFCVTNRDVAITPSSPQVELAQINGAAEAKTLQSEWEPDGQDTTISCSWSGQSEVVGVAVELVAAGICDENTNKKRGSYPQFAPMTLAPCPDGTID